MKKILAAALIAASFSVHAEDDVCKVLGSLAETIAEARDSGVALSAILANVAQSGSQETKDVIRRLAITIYKKTWMDRHEARREFEVSCYEAQT